MSHAPGPWHIDPDPRPGMEWNNHIYAADGLAVCFMAHSDGKDNERDEDSARLIAAAPEVLEALQALSRMYSRAWDRTDGALVMLPPSIPEFEIAHEKAVQAIAKAKGKA